MRGGDSEVVEIVSTESDAYAMEFLSVRTEDGDKAAIGDFTAAWNRRRSYEVNGVGASGLAGADTFGESAKIFGVGTNPNGLVWTAAEVVVFESLAGIGINDGVVFGTVGVDNKVQPGCWCRTE